MSSAIQSSRTQTEKRAIELLGSGLSASVVATSIGISESRISQLMSEKDFADEVSRLRYENLQKHNELDNKYDKLERKVVDQLEEFIPLITKPAELLKAASILNQMKRRGATSPDQMVQTNQVVQLLMPTVITQKFTTNVNNQVINAGNQTLETIQGSVLLNAAKNKHAQLLGAQSRNFVEHSNVSTPNTSNITTIENSQSTETGTAEQTKGNGTASIYTE